MSIDELDSGFRLNDWLVEPRKRRISGAGGSRPRTAEQAVILLSLAERHGESVDSATLRARTWEFTVDNKDSECKYSVLIDGLELDPVIIVEKKL